MDNNDFEIELLDDTSSEELSETSLPLNFLSFGEIESDDIKVYIRQNVYKELEKLASSDTTKELGSILLGRYCEDMGKTYVVISEYIEAKYTDASASTLTFTHDTWDYVHKEHEKLYPQLRIIGWQHTHPNYGIFLSNYDLFIHENFFDLPFQIAYVIDPIQDIRGFFQWKNGKIEKLKGYYIYDDVGKPIKIEQKKQKQVQSMPVKNSKSWMISTTLLCMACIALGIAFFVSQSNYKEIIAEKEDMLSEADVVLEQQQGIINKQSDELSVLQSYFVDGEFSPADSTSVTELIGKLKNNEIDTGNNASIIKALENYLAGNEGVSNIHFAAYKICHGDSLSEICEKNGIDYESNIGIILAINGISNADMIYEGQNILLPVIS